MSETKNNELLRKGTASHKKGLTSALKRFEESMQKKNPAIPIKEKTTVSYGKSAEIIQLPIWSEARRGIPNDLVRGALFTVGNCRSERTFRKGIKIATLGGVDVHYTGEELRQDDEYVFLQLVHLARLIPLGGDIQFTAHSLLKSLEWATNKPSYDRLKKTINRLTATGLEVSSNSGGYAGSLIRDFEWREQDGSASRKWKVRLEPKIISLFGHVKYSQIVWEKRLKLGNLAKWLHSFYYSHANPFPMKVETIHILCGSTTKSRAKFRQMLKKSLNELLVVGFLTEALISSDDKVQVTRT